MCKLLRGGERQPTMTMSNLNVSPSSGHARPRGMYYHGPWHSPHYHYQHQHHQHHQRNGECTNSYPVAATASSPTSPHPPTPPHHINMGMYHVRNPLELCPPGPLTSSNNPRQLTARSSHSGKFLRSPISIQFVVAKFMVNHRQ